MLRPMRRQTLVAYVGSEAVTTPGIGGGRWAMAS